MATQKCLKVAQQLFFFVTLLLNTGIAHANCNSSDLLASEDEAVNCPGNETAQTTDPNATFEMTVCAELTEDKKNSDSSCAQERHTREALTHSLGTGSGQTQISHTQIVKDILAKRSALGLCKGVSPGAPGYGADLLQVAQYDGSRIVALGCMLGTYEGRYNMVHWYPATQSGSLIATEEFNFATGSFEATHEFTGMPSYAYDSKRFINTWVFRGMGDCGTQTEFFPYAGNFALETATIRLKRTCDGRVIPPNQWPLVFPSR